MGASTGDGGYGDGWWSRFFKRDAKGREEFMIITGDPNLPSNLRKKAKLKLQELQAEVLAESKEPKIKFVDYKTSIERLDDILKRIKKRTSYEAAIWRAVFSSERAVLEYLNDERLNCEVAWDQRTGLPSHPSLIADIQQYAKLFRPPKMGLGLEVKKALLQSFSGWTLLGHQTMDCACGRSFKMRKVEMDFMINTLLRVEKNALVMKQLIGIKADDPAHLAQHYDFGKASKKIDDCIIIFESESKVSMKDGRYLLIRRLSQKSAGQFNTDKIIKLITRSIG